jgi:hypothetical protein
MKWTLFIHIANYSFYGRDDSEPEVIGRGPPADPIPSMSEDAPEGAQTDSAATQSTIEVKAPAMPSKAGSEPKRGGERRYAGQNTLPVPGRHLAHRRLPSE